MLGNVAEMVYEKGISKGGGWRNNGSHIISGDNYLCKKNSYRKEFYRSSISSGAVGVL
jgi:hypothetical protein